MFLAVSVSFGPWSASAALLSGRVSWVIDGDTFQLASGERIRVAGIDAPESRRGQAKCEAEITRGKSATRNMVRLLKGRIVTIERVGRSYDRTVARVTIGRHDLGDALIAQGFARPWLPHRPKPNWC